MLACCSIPQDEETIERVVSECDGDEEFSMQFLLDKIYLSACTRTQELLPRPQPTKTHLPNPIPLLPFGDAVMEKNDSGQSALPLPSRISAPLPLRPCKSNIASHHAAAKLRVEASNEAEKMKSFHRKMVKEMKAFPGAGEISRQEGKACRLRMVSLNSRAAAGTSFVIHAAILRPSAFTCESVMLQANNRGLWFNSSSSTTEGDSGELKLSYLQLAAWNLTGVKNSNIQITVSTDLNI